MRAAAAEGCPAPGDSTKKRPQKGAPTVDLQRGTAGVPSPGASRAARGTTAKIAATPIKVEMAEGAEMVPMTPREEPGTTVQKAEELAAAGPKTGRKKTLSQKLLRSMSSRQQPDAGIMKQNTVAGRRTTTTRSGITQDGNREPRPIARQKHIPECSSSPNPTSHLPRRLNPRK